MKEKVWIGPERNSAIIESLSDSLKISNKLCSLLAQRNIKNYQEAFHFFRPNLEDLHDPFLMKGMEKTCSRIHQAIRDSDPILLYGDYDVDGTTAVSLLFRYLKKLSPNIQYYLPDREKEGYGVSKSGIEWAKDKGFGLIISLDCGIKSHAEIKLANSYGIDFIICDHHLPDQNLPYSFSILNPKQEDCPYPFKFLSGCGIAFKLIQALNLLLPQENWDMEECLDLVALSIACDMVEVIGENRILAFYGLKRINSNPQLGISSLLKVCHKNRFGDDPTPKIRFQEILFQLGPRINAAGRLGDAERVVELFTTEDPFLANNIAHDLDEENIKRKEIEIKITQDALNLLKKEREALEEENPLPFSNVLYHPEWHKGLVGIVASRIIEKHYAPTIILTESRGMITGSARSVGDFNIYEAIEECKDLLDQFGGHASAAGLQLKKENLGDFKSRFESICTQRMGGISLKPKLYFQEELDLEEINPGFFKILDQFSPHGPGNPSPLFISRRIKITKGPFKIKESHLKLAFSKKDGQILEGIGFGLAHLMKGLFPQTDYDICYQVEMNHFRGNTTIQLLIKDIKPSQ